MKKKSLFLALIAMMTLAGCTKYNGLPPEEAEHEHTYSEEYSYDANEHWKGTTCGHTEQRKEVGEHTFGEYIISQEPTLTSTGTKVRTCSICGYKDEVILDKLTNDDPGGNNPTWSITDINVDRDWIDLTVGDPAVSITATLVGEGSFPTSLSIECPDQQVSVTTDEGTQIENIKVAQASSSVIDSGKGFTVSPIAEGETKLIISSAANPSIKKELEVTVNAKAESHSIEFGFCETTMNKGSQKVLSCVATDPVVWSTSDDSIVALENKTNSGVWLRALNSSGEDPVIITGTICGGTDNECSVTCKVSVISTEQTVFDYYFINNEKLTEIKLFMWDDNGHNEVWPGISLENADYIDNNLNEVYKISIDKDVRDYKNLIISGKDSKGSLQTVDISVSSFNVQNAFKIASIPNDVSDGVRKASIKICSFNPTTDVLDGDYVSLSMEEVTLFAGNSINVITYSSVNEVTYEVISGSENIALTDASKNGFTVTGVNTGEATVQAKISTEKGDKIALLNVEVVEDELLIYYFVNNYKWSGLKLFMWNDETKKHNENFPGVELGAREYVDTNGNDVYAISYKRTADNWQGFIISGADKNRGDCKTVDVIFDNYSPLSYFQLNGWKDGESKTANVETTNSSHKYYLNVQDNLSVLLEDTNYLNIDTNGENISYRIIDGNSYIGLSECSDQGVRIGGIEIGTATLEIRVGDGADEVTKTCQITVKDNSPDFVTYYFDNNYLWTDLYVFLWGPDGNNAPFPGEKLLPTSLKNSYGNDTYDISFDKNSTPFTGMIISGMDEVHGWAKTEDITLADLDNNGKNMISISETEWRNKDYPNDVPIYKCSYSKDNYVPEAPKLEISCTEITLGVNQEGVIRVTTNEEYIVSINNPEITTKREDGVYKITGLKTGVITLDFYINKDTEKEIKRTCVVTICESAVYKVVEMPDWFGNDNPNIYVWMWGGGNWYKANLVGSELIIENGSGINFEGCKVYRCPNSVEMPTGDASALDGICWNISGKLMFENGIAVYEE